MPFDKIIITILGITGILFTYWFFLLKRSKVVEASDSVDIVVQGGYSPEVIAIAKGKPTKLNFIRKDPSSCLEEVVLSDFKIRKYLPLDQTVTIEIHPQEAGEYSFTCGMNMFHGKIVVK
jgi:plastocyanin domain-containing protein